MHVENIDVYLTYILGMSKEIFVCICYMAYAYRTSYYGGVRPSLASHCDNIIKSSIDNDMFIHFVKFYTCMTYILYFIQYRIWGGM